MNKQLIKALNKANNMPMTKENFLGLVIMLILSKEVFRSNFDVSKFINKTFKISFLNYVVRSRTLMCAKICKHINELSENDIKMAYTHFLNNINTLDIIFNDAIKTSQKSTSKSKHAIRNLNIWINANKKEEE
ncbi:TPA: hypothetical protein L6753_004522 [Escherichia coli]|uniref:hypothetical protein n=1 Tax=Escherichia coli TaxID=562 RepID=UPI000991CAA8|nr:hypothetical protein [Escherichia coli]EFH9337091.1 hypothetical protein [Escherichia coli]EHZ5417162.1 hypothetical protein [Escherichia coli]MBV7020478.1 hypothetical protein [Escherichia coli]GCR42952.1 hypothetical protein BvCmsHHNP001_03980 [Escherichia coli]HAM3551426.1 hypothetical protein [Escherichia coli]